MIAAAAVTIGLRNFSFAGNDALVYAKKTLITGGLTTIAWLVVTFLTRAESNATLVAFYRRVHPTVYGWKRIAKLAPELPEVKDVAGNAFNWLMGVILVYGCLFGIGKLVFQQWGQGILLLVIAGHRRLSDLLGLLAPRLGNIVGQKWLIPRRKPPAPIDRRSEAVSM